jgi:uncharacterized protein
MTTKTPWAAALSFVLTVCLAAATHAANLRPTELFYVNDAANCMTVETTEHIVLANDDLYRQTGAQIVVVTVDTTGGIALEQYAKKLFNDWGVGSGDKQNGLLLLLAITDQNYWITQGQGLENALRAGTLQTLLDTYLEPDFAASRYDAGIRKTFDALLTEMTKIYGVSVGTAGTSGGAGTSGTSGTSGGAGGAGPSGGAAGDQDGGFSWWVWLVIIFILILIFSRLGGRRRGGYHRPRWGGFGGWGHWGGGHWGGHHHHPPPPMGGFGTPHRPAAPPPRAGGGGGTRGGGAGRSPGAGSFGGGLSGLGGMLGGGRPGGGFGGGPRTGGGGGTRGGGAGRR